MTGMVIVTVANSVRREIARTRATNVVWFEAAGMVGPGFVSLLESIVWLECENEVEILQ